MMEINTIIADDESMALSYLRGKIEAYCPLLKVIGEAINSKELVKLILEKKPDVVFMDIEMPESNSFDVLHQIPSTLMPHFVFVTGHIKYSIQALREGALDYLLKPTKTEELLLAYHRIEKKMKETRRYMISEKNLRQSISIKHQTGFKVARLENIVHIKADNNYSLFFLDDGSKILSSQTLGNQKKVLISKWFFRIHRSHLINLSHLKEYSSKEGGDVVMSNGDLLPVACKRVPLLLNQLEFINSVIYK